METPLLAVTSTVNSQVRTSFEVELMETRGRSVHSRLLLVRTSFEVELMETTRFAALLVHSTNVRTSFEVELMETDHDLFASGK